jgi:endoplasmic reticulum resident protein 44
MVCLYSKPGLLKQFIADLHSGKLHREFHNGPDPTSGQPSNVCTDALFHDLLNVLSH